MSEISSNPEIQPQQPNAKNYDFDYTENADVSDDDGSTISRKTAKDLLKKDAALYWKKLPAEYQVDKELVLYVIKECPTLPPKSEFERKFPQSLRFDREYVLAFAKRDDFRILYNERRLFVPEHLKGDKDVMLAYCRKIPRSLQDCTEELTDDREVVEAAVQLAGLELQYASMRLREDEEVVRQACLNHGCALEHCCPGPTRDKLTSDRQFMLAILRQDGGRMLKYAPEPLRRDRDLLLEALAHGMSFRFCPCDIQCDEDFLVAAVKANSQIYLDLQRRDFQHKTAVAIAAVVAPDSTPAVHKRALELCPQLQEFREVALAIATRGDKSFIKDFLTTNMRGEHDTTHLNPNFMPASHFLGDKEIMCQAIQRDCNLFNYCRTNLRTDPDILMAAMTADSACDVLRGVTPEIQCRYPNITVKAIEVANRRGLRILRPFVPEELWRNHRPTAIAWIRRGCRVLEPFEALVRNDRELALEVAEHCWHEFGKVGEELRSDRAFMTEAVDKCGCVLRYAVPSIRDSLPLIVRAVASHPYALTSPISVEQVEVLRYINEKLELHETFVTQFLRGIAISRPHVHPYHRSQLPMLDRGVETGQAFKQLIADFLGVPVGKDLKIMRKAHSHLTNPPPPSSTQQNLDRDVDENFFFGRERFDRRALLRRRMMMRDNGGGGVILEFRRNANNNANNNNNEANNVNANNNFEFGPFGAGLQVFGRPDIDADDDFARQRIALEDEVEEMMLGHAEEWEEFIFDV